MSTHEDKRRSLQVTRDDSRPGRGPQRPPEAVVLEGLEGFGIPLAGHAQLSGKLGVDLSKVRVHADDRARNAAEELGAEAYTLGNRIAVRSANPSDELITHELAHVLQQGGGTGPRTASQSGPRRPSIGDGLAPSAHSAHASDPLEHEAAGLAGQLAGADPPRLSPATTAPQFELVTYSKPVSSSKTLGNREFQSTYTTTQSADAGAVRSALKDLIAAGQIGEISGDKYTYFFPETGCTQQAVETAFQAAAFPKATEMASALMAQHESLLFVGQTTQSVDYDFVGTQTKTTAKNSLTKQDERFMTEYEIGQADMVFAGSVALRKVRFIFGSVMSSDDIARTVFHNIYFPSTPDMPWIVHELVHVWQAERDHGWYIADALSHHAWAWIVEKYGLTYDPYDYGGEKYLTDARKKGKKLTDFAKEPQAAIIEEYYRRLTNPSAGTVTAFLPYVLDLQSS